MPSQTNGSPELKSSRLPLFLRPGFSSFRQINEEIIPTLLQ
jgi:hypothetical protein